MNVLIVGGPHDGQRMDVSLRRFLLPDAEPRLIGSFSPSRYELHAYEVADVEFGPLCLALHSSIAGNPAAVWERLRDGYRQPPRCSCGSEFYCRICGRELGE